MVTVGLALGLRLLIIYMRQLDLAFKNTLKNCCLLFCESRVLTYCQHRMIQYNEECALNKVVSLD